MLVICQYPCLCTSLIQQCWTQLEFILHCSSQVSDKSELLWNGYWDTSDRYFHCKPYFLQAWIHWIPTYTFECLQTCRNLFPILYFIMLLLSLTLQVMTFVLTKLTPVFYLFIYSFTSDINASISCSVPNRYLNEISSSSLRKFY